MNYRYMLKYSINLILLLCLSHVIYAQDNETQKDSIKQDQKYGLRLGGDLGKLGLALFNDNYSGFEINGDFRLTQKLYLAAEIGFEEKTTITDYLNSTAKGSYLKAGIDYNMYENWFGMHNMIYTGFRTGFGTFKQTINGYTIYNTNQSWPQTTVNTTNEFSGLTAVWGELIIGIKVEVIDNLYIGLNAQLKGRITETEPDNFENVYIPGFGKTHDSGRFGLGFGYNLSYLIPFYKKAKKTAKEEESKDKSSSE
ncbi:MAG: hypothetical protein KC469_13920 [Flavobacteriaceae bacterium]|nr:hypothetical protein [Flavobacteriaceae bacterium]